MEANEWNPEDESRHQILSHRSEIELKPLHDKLNIADVSLELNEYRSRLVNCQFISDVERAEPEAPRNRGEPDNDA